MKFVKQSWYFAFVKVRRLRKSDLPQNVGDVQYLYSVCTKVSLSDVQAHGEGWIFSGLGGTDHSYYSRFQGEMPLRVSE